MDKLFFKYLLDNLKPIIEKEDTFYRKELPAFTNLEIVLRFFVTDNYFTSLQYLFIQNLTVIHILFQSVFSI